MAKLPLQQAIFSLFLIHVVHAQVNFSLYPEASQSCLYTAAQNSGCSLEGIAYTINNCLCNDIYGFVSSSASCIGSNDPADLQNVWNIMVGACDATDTPIPFTEAQFLAAGKTSTSPTTMTTSTRAATTSSPSTVDLQITTNHAESTTSPASSAPSSTSSNSGNSNANGDSVGHLSGGMIALISCVATVAALLVAIGVCCGCARRPCFG